MIKALKLKKITLLFAVYALALSPRPVYAYLDPGTGSYIVQILIATLAGGTYLIVTSWDKVKTFLSKIFSRFSRSKNGKSK